MRLLYDRALESNNFDTNLIRKDKKVQVGKDQEKAQSEKKLPRFNCSSVG